MSGAEWRKVKRQKRRERGRGCSWIAAPGSIHMQMARGASTNPWEEKAYTLLSRQDHLPSSGWAVSWSGTEVQPPSLPSYRLQPALKLTCNVLGQHQLRMKQTSDLLRTETAHQVSLHYLQRKCVCSPETNFKEDDLKRRCWNSHIREKSRERHSQTFVSAGWLQTILSYQPVFATFWWLVTLKRDSSFLPARTGVANREVRDNSWWAVRWLHRQPGVLFCSFKYLITYNATATLSLGAASTGLSLTRSLASLSRLVYHLLFFLQTLQ